MRRRSTLAAVAAGVVLALGLSACGGGGGTNEGSEGGGSSAPSSDLAMDAALDQVINPSDKKGGTLKFANAGDWDSLDPGETYYGYSWNFLRYYARPLLMFKPAPGEAGAELIPDLAEDLGVASDGGKTWTYKIKKGVKYEDGTEVTSADVKHAVLRSTDKETFPNGPAYFEQFLDLPEGYKGPYKTPDMNTDSAIETPDDHTIVFHLKKPFAGFDYLAQLAQTAPVPADKDTGANYREHVLSTGPYKFEPVEIGKQYTLVRNDQWDPATDPIRKALPDRIEVQLNVNENDIDNQVKSGDIHVDITGLGVQPVTQSEALTNPELKKRLDNATLPRTWYTSINPDVPPLDNIDCRKAIMFATDKVGLQTAFGGPLAGGEIATGLLPPSIPGFEKLNLYPSEGQKGDVEKAKEHLAACGHPDGFETNMAFRSERGKEKATAESLQQSLARVGIKLNLKPYPQGDYFSQYAGHPGFAKRNGLGLATNGWGADWLDGFGFLSQIVDSRVIRETGGSSNISVMIPEVDKMLDEAVVEQDQATREKMWAAIDRRVMEEAVVLPQVWAKSLLMRPKGVTNVFISRAYGMYDYLNMGVEQ